MNRLFPITDFSSDKVINLIPIIAALPDKEERLKALIPFLTLIAKGIGYLGGPDNKIGSFGSPLAQMTLDHVKKALLEEKEQISYLILLCNCSNAYSFEQFFEDFIQSIESPK